MVVCYATVKSMSEFFAILLFLASKWHITITEALNIKEVCKIWNSDITILVHKNDVEKLQQSMQGHQASSADAIKEELDLHP